MGAIKRHLHHPLLFAPAAPGSDDLLADVLQQARKHGTATYNDACCYYSLTNHSSFKAVLAAPPLAARLQVLYSDVSHLNAMRECMP